MSTSIYREKKIGLPDHRRREEGFRVIACQSIGSVGGAHAWHVIEQKSLGPQLNQTSDDGGEELCEKDRSWRKLHVMTQFHILHEDKALYHDLKRERF